MSKKNKKNKEEEANKALRFRVSAVRSVMTMSLERSYKMGKTHFPELTEHEFIAGLLMALIDATSSILDFSKDMPKSLVAGVIIDLLNDLKYANIED